MSVYQSRAVNAEYHAGYDDPSAYYVPPSYAAGYANTLNQVPGSPEVMNVPWNTDKHPWGDSEKEEYFDLLHMDLANKHELDMWRLNNEYNTPYNQMKRMVEAGINPAAAYGQVSPGNSGSAPGTHMAQTPHWRNTADKLATVNTILNGIQSMFSTVGGIISGAKDVQDIQLGYQNNWLPLARRNAYMSGDTLFGSEELMKSLYPNEVAFEVAPGVYTTRTNAVLFPEIVSALSKGTAVKEYELHKNLNSAQTRVDKLIQDTLDSVRNGNWSGVLDNVFELLLYRFSGTNGRRLNLNFLKK